MKITFEEQEDTNFLEIQLTERDLKKLLMYQPIEDFVDDDDLKHTEIYIWRKDHASEER